MRLSHFALGAVALAAVTAVAVSIPASATPGAPAGGLKSTAAEQSLIEKTHGWHRRCRWGFNGVHKHIPGVGRIQCATRRCWTNKWGVKRCVWF